jgi:hypothetical protein
LAATAGIVLSFATRSSPAEAADFLYSCPQPGADAGTTANLAINPGEQLMIRCPGYSGVTYRECQTSSCTATSTDSVLDADKSIDVCTPSQYTTLSLYKLYDGGNPLCCVYKVYPSMKGVCAK